MNLHILQHVPFEGPGYIARWAQEHAHRLTFTRFYEAGHHLPDLVEVDALVILGGPMDVFSEHQYEWLHAEKVFIEDCIQAGKQVLGICLGAQLAAYCLGAMVSTAPNKEIGWYPVRLSEDSKHLPWFQQLFQESPVVLHWHGDKFQIPYGGFELLYSEANRNQAFIFGDNVLGLQFHLEVTEETIPLMLEGCGHELRDAEFIQSEKELAMGIAHTASVQQIMSRILDGFFIPKGREI